MQLTLNEKIKRIYIPFLIYLTLFFGFFGSTLAYPKLSYLFLYRIFYAILLISILTDILLNGIKVKKLVNFTVIFLFGWTAYSLLSFLWVQDIKNALRDQVFLCANIFIIIILMYYSEYINFSNVLKLISIAYFINILVGFYEVLFDKHLWTSKVLEYKLHNVPSTFFSNPNDFATYIVLYLPFIFGFLIRERSKIMKLLYMLSIIGSLMLIILTTSRANYIALLIMAVVYFLIIDNNEKRNFLKIFGIVILIFLLIIGFNLDFGAGDRIVNFVSTQINSLIDFSVSELSSNVRRELLLVYGMSFLYDYFFFGVGSGNSRVLMQKYKEYTVNLELHNWFADVLVSYGILIFTLYIIWILYIIVKLVRSRRYFDGDLRLGAYAEIAALSSFWISSISSSKMIEMRIMWFIFAIAGFYLAKIEKQRGENKN